MSFETRATADLVRIAAAGGGFRLEAGSCTNADLVRVAAAAATSGARLTFSGLGTRTTADLVRIGAAGNGGVVLED